MLEALDIWDPNNWEVADAKSITLSTDGAICCWVDAIYYEVILAAGPWNLYDYGGKQYAKRTRRKGEFEEPGVSVYLHRWIKQRILKEKPPSPRHCLVDHKDGDGLNNRGFNLVWATPQLNALNRYGMWWQQKDFIRELEQQEKQARAIKNGSTRSRRRRTS